MTASETTLDRAPDILDKWIAWAGPRARLPKRSIAETRSVIAEVREEAADALRDETCWGPAKQVAMAMVADGVDVTDPAEVDAWVARRVEFTTSDPVGGTDVPGAPSLELVRR